MPTKDLRVRARNELRARILTRDARESVQARVQVVAARLLGRSATTPDSLPSVLVSHGNAPVIRRELDTRWHHLRTALTTLLAAGTLLGCSDSTSPNKGATFFGPATAMAGGTARSYVTLDRAGVPTELGMALTEATLTGLPSVKAEFVFTLPSQASATSFKHAVINWEPNGHPPPMVYTVPHLDVHFYMISQAARAGMVLGDSTLAAKMLRQPSAEFVPAGYVAGMASALMGLHWRDPNAPEMHGQAFTKAFIYGSYDGAFIFAEPMVTKAFLETKPAADATPVKLPAQHATRGYQATSYTVGYDAATNEYRIALSGLVLR